MNKEDTYHVFCNILVLTLLLFNSGIQASALGKEVVDNEAQLQTTIKDKVGQLGTVSADNIPANSYFEGNTLILGDTSIDLSTFSGKKVDLKISGSDIFLNGNRINGAHNLQFQPAPIPPTKPTQPPITPKPTTTPEPTSQQQTPAQNEGVFASQVASMTTESGKQITGGLNVQVFSNGDIIAEHVDTFRDGGSLSTQVESLWSQGSELSVGSADTVITGCTTFTQVEDTLFTFEGESVSAQSSAGEDYRLTDCSYQESAFESYGDGTLRVLKDDTTPRFEIERGALTCLSSQGNESVQANNRAVIQYGTDCFECIDISPVGSYLHNDAQIEKDFAIRIPENGKSPYTLCLKKNAAQMFADADGVVDFVEKNIELGGIAQYKRYPLQNNAVSALLSEIAYEGRDAGLSALLPYDDNLLFLQSIALRGISTAQREGVIQSDAILSLAKPSSYYQIDEGLYQGEQHSVLYLDWDQSPASLTQNINYRYETDDALPPLVIDGNVGVMENGHKLLILPPEHSLIGELLAQ